MHTFSRTHKGSALALACISALSLTACGGGGGGNGTGSSGANGLNLHGTVATGLPVVGAAVSAKCATGASTTPATTDAQGNYKLDISGAAAPCILQATGGKVGGAANAQTLHGFAAAAGTANLTPLTELALARAAGKSPAQAFGAYDAAAAQALQAKLGAAQTYLKAQLAALGLSLPKDTDVFVTPFKADGQDAADKTLDQLAATLKAQDKTLPDLAAAAAQNKPATDALGDKVVNLQFAARSGDAPITCGDMVKVKGTDMQAADFRFYISNVQLLKADGSKVALKLPANDNYNYTTEDGKDSVSLIDLRQPKGYCSTKATYHPAITGTVPWGDYTGVEFTLGVPLAVNHLNPANDTTTPAVLRSSVHPAMSWAWRAGRKFTNIEMELPLGFKKDANGAYLDSNGKIIASAVRDAFGRLYDASGNTISNGMILDASGTFIAYSTLKDPATGAEMSSGPVYGGSNATGEVYATPNTSTPIPGAKVLDENGNPVTTVATYNVAGVIQKDVVGKWVPTTGWKVVDAQGKPVAMRVSRSSSQDKWSLLHLGSTTCPAQNSTAGNPGAAAPGECNAPNRVPMTFAQFNPATQQIALDVQALFADDDLSVVNGCMSGITHKACAGPFKALALDWKLDGSGNGQPIAGQAQTVFKVVAK